ncbi:protease modulator HflK N-terminal domain-containing protein [Escherichia coli]
MAWNQPGNNGQDRDPWEAANPAATLREMETKAVAIKGPPDLDDIFRKLSKKLGGLGGGKGTGSGGGSSSQRPAPAAWRSCRYHRSGSDCHYLGGQWFLYH